MNNIAADRLLRDLTPKPSALPSSFKSKLIGAADPVVFHGKRVTAFLKCYHSPERFYSRGWGNTAAPTAATEAMYAGVAFRQKESLRAVGFHAKVDILGNHSGTSKVHPSSSSDSSSSSQDSSASGLGSEASKPKALMKDKARDPFRPAPLEGGDMKWRDGPDFWGIAGPQPQTTTADGTSEKTSKSELLKAKLSFNSPVAGALPKAARTVHVEALQHVPTKSGIAGSGDVNGSAVDVVPSAILVHLPATAEHGTRTRTNILKKLSVEFPEIAAMNMSCPFYGQRSPEPIAADFPTEVSRFMWQGVGVCLETVLMIELCFKMWPDTPVVVTGHSLGGSVAGVAAALALSLGLPDPARNKLAVVPYCPSPNGGVGADSLISSLYGFNDLAKDYRNVNAPTAAMEQGLNRGQVKAVYRDCVSAFSLPGILNAMNVRKDTDCRGGAERALATKRGALSAVVTGAFAHDHVVPGPLQVACHNGLSKLAHPKSASDDVRLNVFDGGHIAAQMQRETLQTKCLEMALRSVTSKQ